MWTRHVSWDKTSGWMAGYWYVVFCSWVAISVLISIQILFFFLTLALFVPCDVIRLTGNNMSYVFHIRHSTFSVYHVSFSWFLPLFMLSADHNGIHGQLLFLHPVMAVLLPDVQSHPASLDPVAAHLNLTEMLQSKGRFTAPLLMWWEKTLHVWSDFIVTPVKLISRRSRVWRLPVLFHH